MKSDPCPSQKRLEIVRVLKKSIENAGLVEWICRPEQYLAATFWVKQRRPYCYFVVEPGTNSWKPDIRLAANGPEHKLDVRHR
jgi:hypothetical protein